MEHTVKTKQQQQNKTLSYRSDYSLNSQVLTFTLVRS